MRNKKNDLRKFAPFLLASSKELTINNLDFIYSDDDFSDLASFDIIPNSINQFDSIDNGGVEYLVFPSWNNPRFFVCNDKNLIKNIGNLIKPTSFKAKMAWKVALILNRFNAIKLLFSNSLFVKTNVLGGLFLKANNQQKSKFIIYTGAVGIYQKWTVQEMNEENMIMSFSKIGKNKLSIERIYKEQNCLQFLSDMNFDSFEIPTLIDFYQVNEFSIIKQGACDADYNQVISEFSYQHQQVLEELHLKLSKDIVVDDFINHLRKEKTKIAIEDIYVQSIVSLIGININNLESQLKNRKVLNFTFSHGDYTQWNSFSNGEKLFVFDWEMGDYRMPLWDYFNFIYHSVFLVHNFNEKILQKLLFQNYNWANLLVDNMYDTCHKVYLIEITIHYLHQYQELRKIGIENSVYKLIEQFPKFLKAN